MCGGGASGVFFEHIEIHNSMFGGAQSLARALAMLLTGDAPVEAIKCFRSGRAHTPLKPGSAIDIWPLVSPSPYWRAAVKGWSSMFAEEVLVAVSHNQYGCGKSGGAVALRHFVEASLLQRPSLCLAVVDVRNMHGSLGVANIEEQVRNSLPRM